MTDLKQIHHFHQPVIKQDGPVGIRRPANIDCVASCLNRGKKLSKAFIKPGLQIQVEISLLQLVTIFVEYNRPRIFHRHVEQDEATVFSSLKKSCQLNWLPFPQGNKLAHLFCIAESDNL